jgi:hypothetical protein
MDVPIPPEWVASVCKLLREGDRGKITWTKSAFLEWQAATLSAFQYEAYEAMLRALTIPNVVGCDVPLPEVGKTYAFFFTANDLTLYGKICLRPDNLHIKIISAHTPRRGATLS